jgi:hypothetical protein
MSAIEQLTEEQRTFLSKITCGQDDNWEILHPPEDDSEEICVIRWVSMSFVYVIFYKDNSFPPDVSEVLFDHANRMIESETFPRDLFDSEDDMIEAVNAYFTV